MINRRQIMQLSASMLAARSLGLGARQDDAGVNGKTLIQRPIPHSGELLPVMGMGTSRTFDTPDDAESLAALKAVLQVFFDGGGTVIDSSPMYGNAESRVGDVLRALPERPKLFAATKVWTTGRQQGIAQMEESARRMSVERFDLIAVHNLQDWQTQLDTLKNWKAEGKVRYIGITTSHGRDHETFLKVMRSEPVDFAQFSYNIEDRTAERELLPVAAERGIATMINRPYQRGALFNRSRGKELPALALDLDCSSWGQFYLKFILGHPAVTCIIPATASVSHMTDNMRANFGRLPDPQQRAEMLRFFEQL
jgi:aryl-alcohol dehydrogenase-like predicted oxidoreductase